MTDPVSAPAWSLRTRLAQGLVLTALLPMLLFALVLLLSQWQRGREDLLLRLDANARLGASVIDDLLDAQLAGVRLLSDQLSEDPVVRAEELSRLLYVYPAMLRALQVDARGDVVAARDARGRRLSPYPGLVADDAWFREARAQFRPQVTGVYQRRVYGSEVVIGVAAPLLRAGRFEGAVQAEIPVQAVVGTTAESLARRQLALLLIDRGNRVVHAAPTLRWRALDDAGAEGEVLRRLAVTPDRPGTPVLREGLLRDGGAAYVDAVTLRNGWTLVLVGPRQLLWAPILPRLVLLAFLLLACLLGVAWSLWLQRRLLGRGIGTLLASLRGYALGGRIDPAQVEAMPAELQPLAAGIGDLGARMNAAFAELKIVLDEREHEIATRTESLRNAVAELDRLSRTDAMTGSLNYRGFTEAGERLWQAARETDRPLSVLALDIDHFKRYNDLYGHAEGDSALRRFAGAVRSALLHADDVLARPGGEEFTVFLPDTTHAQALLVARRICQRVRDADIAHAGSPKQRLTVSVGVATLGPADEELEDVLKRADAALYRVKAAGRDGVSA
ncbi:MAG TPA: diguanylate cyclase [Thermomonas sp.]